MPHPEAKIKNGLSQNSETHRMTMKVAICLLVGIHNAETYPDLKQPASKYIYNIKYRDLPIKAVPLDTQGSKVLMCGSPMTDPKNGWHQKTGRDPRCTVEPMISSGKII